MTPLMLSNCIKEKVSAYTHHGMQHTPRKTGVHVKYTSTVHGHASVRLVSYSMSFVRVLIELHAILAILATTHCWFGELCKHCRTCCLYHDQPISHAIKSNSCESTLSRQSQHKRPQDLVQLAGGRLMSCSHLQEHHTRRC